MTDWERHFGVAAPFRLLERLTADGWTTSTTDELAGIVDAATGGVTRVAGTRAGLAVLLAGTAHTLVLMAELPVTQALAWVRVLAAEPVWRPVDRPGGLVYAEPGGHRPLERWLTGVPRELAPLAFSAGLDPVEAAAQPLQMADLRMLAALRGVS